MNTRKVLARIVPRAAEELIFSAVERGYAHQLNCSLTSVTWKVPWLALIAAYLYAEKMESLAPRVG